MKKKILALCLVVVLAVTAVTGATLAYFTDTREATNTFTVGELEIKLDEQQVEYNDETNEYVEVPDSRVTENQYDDIAPGMTLPKDPTVTITKGSEDCYVRMKVTVNTKNLKNAFPEFIAEDGTFLLEKLIVGWDPTVWVYQKAVAEGDNTTYEFWYKDMVPENDNAITVLPDLFTAVKIPNDATNEDMYKLTEGLEAFTVAIKAEAIQAATFNNAAAAFAALDA